MVCVINPCGRSEGSDVCCRFNCFKQLWFHRCKRKKQVVTVTQFQNFCKYFANVPLRAANVTFTKSILCGRWQKHPVTWSAPALQFCVCQARTIWQRGRLERLLLRAWFKCAIPARIKTNMQKKRVACLRATRNWVDLFEAVFPTAFKHIVPNLVGLSGAGSRCGPTWLSSKSRLVVSSVVPATDDSLSINVNVKNRRPWSRNMKDLEDSLKMCLYAWKRH